MASVRSLVLSLLFVAGCSQSELPPDTATRSDAVVAHCQVKVTGRGVLDVEADYLPHVVRCENGNAPPEALRAQAIAARSFLYYTLQLKGYVNDSQGDQVYGCSAEPGPEHIAAVQDTLGLVVQYAGEQVCTFFVAGSTNVQPPACIGSGGATEGHVTYNQGKSGSDKSKSSLGGKVSANQGCMSQNGSSCLANAGMGYADILRFYYGADIDIVRADGACIAAIDPGPGTSPDPTTGGTTGGMSADGAGGSPDGGVAPDPATAGGAGGPDGTWGPDPTTGGADPSGAAGASTGQGGTTLPPGQNRSPSGALERANCAGLRGWAYDADAPSSPLTIHILVDAEKPNPGVVKFTMRAADSRQDLCDSIGSCEHGFHARLPDAIFDGTPHILNAFADDPNTGDHVKLPGSGLQVSCAPSERPTGSSLGPDAAGDATGSSGAASGATIDLTVASDANDGALCSYTPGPTRDRRPMLGIGALAVLGAFGARRRSRRRS